MKKVFLLTVAGEYDPIEDRAPQFPTGCVYTQQGQLFGVIAQFEEHKGIEKLVASLQSTNSLAVKAANAAVRNIELKDIHFDNDKTVTYARLGTALRTEGRVVLYRTVEWENRPASDERAYVIWRMGVNDWPNFDGKGEQKEWWEKEGRFVN